MKFIGLAFVLTLFLSINIVSAQYNQDSVIVLPIKIAAPANAKKLGAIKIGNNANKLHCDYEGMIASARQKAKAMGGNIVKITQMNDPVFISKCYSIKADVYYVKELPDYKVQNAINPAGMNSGYATLYIYRLRDTTMMATGYKVHLDNDSVICNVKGRSRDSIDLYKEGTITLWAETEKRQDLKLDVKSGHSYYVRCGLKSGELRMIPVLQLMDNNPGMAEYEALKKKKKGTNKNTGIQYLRQIH
jgi:hypothetical protein